MSLEAKIQNPAEPVIFYEVIPPGVDATAELEARLELVSEIGELVDAINIPEIRDETRRGARRTRLRERIEPRAFARAIREASHVETVVNRVTVHESCEEQRRWLREGYSEYGIRTLILVGGESNEIQYPGPSVLEAASLTVEESLPFLLGGITIPSRAREAQRIREKRERGLRFFTTQVLLDSGDIVNLIQGLNGLEARILLSFTPISNIRDLEFLEWLGVAVPAPFREAIRQAGDPQQAVELSFALARQILVAVFENLPSRPPALGLQVERITKRNSAAARQMLAELSGFYRRLLQARYPAPSVGVGATASRLRSRSQQSSVE